MHSIPLAQLMPSWAVTHIWCNKRIHAVVEMPMQKHLSQPEFTD